MPIPEADDVGNAELRQKFEVRTYYWSQYKRYSCHVIRVFREVYKGLFRVHSRISEVFPVEILPKK